MGSKQNEYGEGNYKASREYNEATKKFVESGRVDKAARDAAPRSPQEAQEMKVAEEAALLRAMPGTLPKPSPAPPMRWEQCGEVRRNPEFETC